MFSQCMHHDIEDQLSSTFAIYIQLSLFAGTTSSCWEYQTPDREILKAWVTNDVRIHCGPVHDLPCLSPDCGSCSLVVYDFDFDSDCG